ncbi:MAG: ABC transporter permease [Deltaproteobacteria bacterium]|nr:ABC transporter permease [Deltaproteobacteria bacterium]
MTRYIVRRLILGIVVVGIVSVIIFIVSRIGPDPALMIAPPGADEAEIKAIHERFGLNKPWPVQYYIFIKRALQGDFGESIYYGLPVSEIMWQRIPNTILLVGAAQLIALGIGVSAGVLAARRRGQWLDNLVRWFSLAGLSMPNFWIAMLLILIFSVTLRVLPTAGSGTIWHLLMPAFSLGWYFSAGYTRITYSSLFQVLNSEYIKMARIKGLSEFAVVGKHALKNALIPIVTLAGMNLVIMVSSAVAIETVFSWPGVGLLMYHGAIYRDFNIAQAVVLFISVSMVIMNLLVDILYAYIDPRIRYQ